MSTRTFALVMGIILLVSGIAGFVPGLVHESQPAPTAPTAQPAADAAYGYLFGLFPTNALHNIFHLLWGVFGLIAYRSFSGARTFARVTAVVYAVLTVLGFIPGLNTLFGLIPLYGHDVWLHALITIAAAYFGFAATTIDTERPVTASEAGTRRL